MRLFCPGTANDATGRAPAHYGNHLAIELPWSLPEAQHWEVGSHLLHAATKVPGGKAPHERTLGSPCRWLRQTRPNDSRLKEQSRESTAIGVRFATDSLSATQESLGALDKTSISADGKLAPTDPETVGESATDAKECSEPGMAVEEDLTQ